MWEFLWIKPRQFLASIIWVALIHSNVITLRDPFGCGALHRIFGYVPHISQESVILWLMKPPEFFMTIQNGSLIPAFMCQSHKPWGPHLFASRLNFQTKPYIAWHPDPGAFVIDAFSVDWGEHYFYVFPPFSLIDRVLRKVEADEASGIPVVPQRTIQPWFPVLMCLLVQEPFILPRGKKVLQLPYNPNAIHPLHHKLTLMACKLSGRLYKVKDFQSKLLTLSCHHGKNQQRNSTGPTLQDGISFQLNSLVIPCNQL